MADNLLYPVHLYEEGMDLPKEGTYFVVAGNGTWLHKDTGLVRCFVPVESISFLQDLNADVQVSTSLPKVPARLVWRIKEFFRRVVESHHSESGVILYYSKEKGDYKVHIPEQKVSHGGVKYERVALTHVEGMEDYLRVGTIHSHCDFNAFHSGTDEGDEEDFDGLHVTFGHNDKDEFSISASVVVNGFRTKIDPRTVLEGITSPTSGGMYMLTDRDYDRQFHEWADGLDEWMKKVSPMGGPVWGRQGCWSLYKQYGFERGDNIVWAGDLSQVKLKEVMGEGPFEVIGVDGDKLVIKTSVGLAKLSDKLFKKAE